MGNISELVAKEFESRGMPVESAQRRGRLCELVAENTGMVLKPEAFAVFAMGCSASIDGVPPWVKEGLPLAIEEGIVTQKQIDEANRERVEYINYRKPLDIIDRIRYYGRDYGYGICMKDVVPLIRGWVDRKFSLQFVNDVIEAQRAYKRSISGRPQYS
jgi:hypothetical protein